MSHPILFALAALLIAAPAFAQPATGNAHAAHHEAASAAAATDLVDGEVRRVDRDAQKLTLRHGPIPNLGMGNMTMVFRVSDTKALEGLKPGDRIRFKADTVDGQLTVTAIEPAQ